MNYGIENIIKDNSTNLQKLISLIKTPEQIINLFKERLDYIKISLKRIITNKIEITTRDLSVLSGNLKLANNLIKFQSSNIKNLSNNLNSIIDRELFNRKQKYKNYLRLIETNSIQSNLKKGYSILSKSNKIINNSKFVKENDILSARLLDKTIKLKVKKIN
jgi:exonuclease VII large subunit